MNHPLILFLVSFACGNAYIQSYMITIDFFVSLILSYEYDIEHKLFFYLNL